MVTIKDMLNEILPELVELLRPLLSGVRSVIDIGTGSSVTAHFFAKHFPDIEFFTVDIADMRQEKELPFILYNGKSLPFHDKEFTISVLNETLHHTQDPGSVLTEAKRVAEAVYVVEHFPLPGIPTDKLRKDEMSTLEDLSLECSYYKPFTRNSLFDLFDRTNLDVEVKFKMPYHGSREIEKYFFKLVRK
ncbi:MAG: methyltransferase domain-containing protein [Bacteroidales bacterium]|nr:MAG: methyltransferase domain-containing protein [Bacteroidales bacterium]